MKRTFLNLALALVAILSFSACSDDEEQFVQFSLRPEIAVIDGNDSQPVMDYMKAIETAYVKALGMNDGSRPLVTTSGDYKAQSAEIKAKFEAVMLPDPIEYDGTYTFVYVLEGTDHTGVNENEKLDIVATKTFTNK